MSQTGTNRPLENRSSDAWSAGELAHKPVRQMPAYPDAERLAAVESRLRRYPPLVFAGEARRLKASLAEVADGRAFVLQGGDCAESYRGFHRQHHPRHLPGAAADGGCADLRQQRACREDGSHGGAVRQAAQRRHRERSATRHCRATVVTSSTARPSRPRPACPIRCAWRPATSSLPARSICCAPSRPAAMPICTASIAGISASSSAARSAHATRTSPPRIDETLNFMTRLRHDGGDRPPDPGDGILYEP